MAITSPSSRRQEEHNSRTPDKQKHFVFLFLSISLSLSLALSLSLSLFISLSLSTLRKRRGVATCAFQIRKKEGALRPSRFSVSPSRRQEEHRSRTPPPDTISRSSLKRKGEAATFPSYNRKGEVGHHLPHLSLVESRKGGPSRLLSRQREERMSNPPPPH